MTDTPVEQAPHNDGDAAADSGATDQMSDQATADRTAFNSVRACRERLYGSSEFRTEVRNAPEVRSTRQMDPTGLLIPEVEMREVANGTGGTSLRFTGYASVVNSPYSVSDAFGPYQETINRSAFNKTLKDGADVAFLLNHGGPIMSRTKAGTLKLSADSTGLYTDATLNPTRPDVQILRAAVEDKNIDEMSMAFRAVMQSWDENYENREILECSLHQGDVSAVNFGANGATAGTVSMRSRFAISDLGADELVAALIELRAGAAISSANMKTLSTVLDLVQGADTNVDHALVMISDLLGVKNPDIDQDAAMDKDDPSKNTPPTTTDGNSTGEADPPVATARAVIPDHTLEARQRLAAMRARRSA
jgi:HK97 family phage prohead protease